MHTYTRIFIIISALLVIPFWMKAQGFTKRINPAEYKDNFLGLSKQINMFYDTATGSNRSGYKQWKRWEWFAKNHLDSDGHLNECTEANIKAVEIMDKMSDGSSRSTTGDWINLGHSSLPGDEAQMGRVNSFAFDPIFSQIIYVGTAGGGIWKSFDSGNTWINLTVDLPILGIADIVVAPSPNNNIVYALTGDITGGIANKYYHNSVGVIKSFNGGLSWTRTGLTHSLTQGLGGYKLLMHPANPNMLLAAMSDGIHRTMDGGNTWNLIAAVSNVNDMEFNLNDLNILYFTSSFSNNFSKINLTTNFISNVFINAPLSVDRMEIAVTPDNVNAVYLLVGPGYVSGGMNLFNGLYYSNNNGASFILRSNSCNGNADLFNSAASFAWYANTIFVDPFEENNVVLGGKNLFISTNGGVNLSQVTANSIHADQHNMKRNPLNGNLWLGNDGGAYRSTDNGNTWTNKSNGLTINEYYRICGTNGSLDLLLGGTQDNGHFLRNTNGDFQFVMDGDGMDNYFNSVDYSIAYACSQNGGLKRSSNGGLSFSPTSLPNEGDGNFYPWITPIIQYPPTYNFGSNQWENTDFMYVYSLNGIMRNLNELPWFNIGPPAISTTDPCPSMAICRDAGGTILYISNGNNIWSCSNPLDPVPAWSIFIPPFLNGGTISAMAVNPVNRLEIWIVISGYVNGTKVFRSQNAGVSWSNLSLSLPNVPMYSIVFANDSNSPGGAVYVGSEIGVFYTDDSLPDWIPFSNRLPHVPITDLQINYVLGKLKAATFGRGIWESDLYETCPSLILVDFDINQGQYNFESSNVLYANHYISGGLGVKVRMKASNQIRLTNGFRIFPDSDVKIKIGDCGSGIQGLTIPSHDTTLMVSRLIPQVKIRKTESTEENEDD